MKKSQLKNIIREVIKEQLGGGTSGPLGNFMGTTEAVPCTQSGGIAPTNWAIVSGVGWQPKDFNQPGRIDIQGCYRVQDPNGNMIDGSHGQAMNVKIDGLGADPNAWYVMGNYNTTMLGGTSSPNFPTQPYCSNPIATITMYTLGTSVFTLSGNSPSGYNFPNTLPVGQGCTPNFSGPVIVCNKKEGWDKGGMCEPITSTGNAIYGGMPGNPGWTSI